MEKYTVSDFLKERRDSTAWGMVSFMFNHKYAEENGDFDTMNETPRRCGEYLVEMGEPVASDGNGWGDDNGEMVYYTAEGKEHSIWKNLFNLCLMQRSWTTLPEATLLPTKDIQMDFTDTYLPNGKREIECSETALKEAIKRRIEVCS